MLDVGKHQVLMLLFMIQTQDDAPAYFDIDLGFAQTTFPFPGPHACGMPQPHQAMAEIMTIAVSFWESLLQEKCNSC